jgi:hypothetical protein
MFPSEIDLCIEWEMNDGDKTHYPATFYLDLDYCDDPNRLHRVRKSRTTSGEWTLLAKRNHPKGAEIGSWSLTGGLTKSFLDDQQPGLVTLVGQSLANEFSTHMLEMVRSFNSRGLTRNLRFRNIDDYYSLMLELQQKFCQPPSKLFDRDKALKVYTNAWTSKKYGPNVHLQYLSEHRPQRAGNAQRQHDLSVAAFQELIAMAASSELARQLSFKAA